MFWGEQMAIIKAQDFERVQRGELTIQELKKRNERTDTYNSDRQHFRQKLSEFSANANRDRVGQKDEVLRLKNKVMLLIAYNKRAEGEIVRLRKYFEQENNKNKNTELKLELLRKRIDKEQSYKEAALSRESSYQKERQDREFLLKKASLLADNLAQQLTKKQQDLTSSFNESERLQQQIINEQVVLKKTEYELNLLKTVQTATQQELTSEKNKNAETAIVLNELTAKLSTAEITSEKTQVELTQLQEQLNIANAKSDALSSKLTESVLEQEALQIKFQEATTQIEETAKKLNALQQEQTESLASGQVLRAEILELTDNLTAAEQRVSEIDKNTKHDQEKLLGQETELCNLKETLTKDRAVLNEEILYLKSQLIEGEEDLAVLNKQQQIDQDYIKNFQEELVAFKNTIKQDKEALVRGNREIARLNQKIEEIGKGSTDKIIENTMLKKEVEVLTKKIEVTVKKEAELKEAEEDIAALGYEQKYYTEQINLADQKIALIQKKLSKHELIGRKVLEMLKELYETPDNQKSELKIVADPVVIKTKRELENNELKEKIVLLKDGRDEKKVISLNTNNIKEKKAKIMMPMLFNI